MPTCGKGPGEAQAWRDWWLPGIGFLYSQKLVGALFQPSLGFLVTEIWKTWSKGRLGLCRVPEEL